MRSVRVADVASWMPSRLRQPVLLEIAQVSRRTHDYGFASPKRPIPGEVISTADRFKITARYTVDIAPGKAIRCVRVRGPGQRVMHFSRERFDALFRMVDDEPPPREAGKEG